MTNKFTNFKIYKISNSVNSEIYIGGTVNSLSKRYGQHLGKIKHYPNRKLYKNMLNVGLENNKIELVENFPCKNKDDALVREQYWADKLGTLNSNQTKNLYTPHEYYIRNKQEFRERYLRINSKTVKCECGAVLRVLGMPTHLKSKRHLINLTKLKQRKHLPSIIMFFLVFFIVMLRSLT